jgi:4-hydroxy-4-methyl-2-oxoglutarate aldolase
MTIDDHTEFEPLIGMRAATIYEAAGKIGDMAPSIRCCVPGTSLIGRAFTVKCWPGDGSAFLNAIGDVPPGWVMVIDGGDSERLGCWGGSATLAARQRGIAGVVTNGSVRDMHIISELRFPVFAAGTSVRGGVRHHPGWTGIPIAVGGVPVHHGDLVVADDDGVVVVPADRISAIIPAALARQAMEKETEAKLRAGGDFAQLANLSRRS